MKGKIFFATMGLLLVLAGAAGEPCHGEGTKKKKSDVPSSETPAPYVPKLMSREEAMNLLTEDVAEAGLDVVLDSANRGQKHLKGGLGAGTSRVGTTGVGTTAPGGAAFYREAMDSYFGPGIYDKFNAFVKDPQMAQMHKSAMLDMTLRSGDFASLELDAQAGTVSKDSPEFVGKIKDYRDAIRGDYRRLNRDPGELPGDRVGHDRPGPGVKHVPGQWFGPPSELAQRVLDELQPAIQKMFPGKPGEEDSLFYRPPRPKPDPDTSQGQNQLSGGNAPKAKESFDKAINRDPENAAAYSGRAMANYMMQNYPGAVQDAESALALNPDDKNAFSTLKLSESRVTASPSAAAEQAAAQLSFGSFDAPSAGKAGSRLDPSQGQFAQSAAQVRLVEKALRMGDYDAARSLARKALELNPNNAQAHFYASVANANLRRYQDAQRDAEAGLKLAPNSSALLNAKAFALNRQKDYKAALKAAQAALELNPKDAAAYANRAHALGGLGDREGMLENLKKAASLDPKFQSSLDSALQMPADSDLLFLFPGEARPESQKAAAEAAPAKAHIGTMTFVLIALGLLLAVGLFVFAFGVVDAGPVAVQGPPAVGSLGPKALAAGPRSSPPGADAPSPLTDKFEIVRQIGAGGMGVVFEGIDRTLGRKVAIKKMRDELRLDGRERDRFLAEARTVAALHHPNIVEIYSILEEGGQVYLVFEHVAGLTLHEIVAKEGRLPLDRAVAVFQGIASALDFAHGRNVIHRDLKPSNVMVDDEGYVRVMDFGVARVAKDAINRFSVTNTVLGTPPYMPPEQENGIIRREADVYAMAVCLYEALSGRQPFSGVGSGMLLNKMNMSFPPISKVVPGLPPGIDELFRQALAADPEKRTRSAGELAKALMSLVSPAGRRVARGQMPFNQDVSQPGGE
ncbi:MAG: protein kinase [Elusimicrobia bacterium]|nr:protein kinase [Elusimicrobiota bacterium]